MHLVVDRSVKLSSSLLFFPSLVSVSFLLEAAFVEIEVDLEVYSVQFQVCTGNTDSTQWYNKTKVEREVESRAGTPSMRQTFSRKCKMSSHNSDSGRNNTFEFHKRLIGLDGGFLPRMSQLT